MVYCINQVANCTIQSEVQNVQVCTCLTGTRKIYMPFDENSKKKRVNTSNYAKAILTDSLFISCAS